MAWGNMGSGMLALTVADDGSGRDTSEHGNRLARRHGAWQWWASTAMAWSA